MFSFFNFLKRKKALSFDALQTVQTIATQVVLSVEGGARISGLEKKALALKITGDLLEASGVVAPDSVVDNAIEAAVTMMKIADRGISVRKVF